MTRVRSPQAPKMGFGELVGGAFRSWIAGAAVFAVASLVLHGPLALAAIAMLDPADPKSDEDTTWALVQTFVGGPLGYLATAAVCYGVVQRLRERPAGVGPMLGAAMRRFWSVIWAGVLMALIAFACMIPVGIVVAVVAMGVRGGSAIVLLVLLGLVGAVVTGLVLSRLFVTIPGVVVERLGPGRALGESWRLTAGHHGRLFVLQLLLLLVPLGVGTAAQVLEMDPRTSALVTIALGAAVVTPMSASAQSYAYQGLKQRKDGVDVLEAAKAFD